MPLITDNLTLLSRSFPLWQMYKKIQKNLKYVLIEKGVVHFWTKNLQETKRSILLFVNLDIYLI